MSMYRDAMAVQDASNLSGVVHSMSRLLTVEIWPEVRANGGGTDQVNHHPVVKMFVAQLLWLSYNQTVDTDQYHEAYQTCHHKEVEESKDGYGS
ncbi:MAG: hypothetical protein ACWGQW_03175 [bacterium]